MISSNFLSSFSSSFDPRPFAFWFLNQLLIEQRNYAHIPTYIFKAENALDGLSSSAAAPNASSSATATATAPAASQSAKKDPYAPTYAKLALCTALSLLSQGAYAKAGAKLLSLPASGAGGAWIGTIVGPGDISTYATLCALATLDRPEVKRKLVDGDAAPAVGEGGMRELVDAWMTSRFKTVLELLQRYSVSSSMFASTALTSLVFLTSFICPLDATRTRPHPRSTRREPDDINPRAGGRALFPAICDRPA